MKHLLLPSIIAILTIAPTLADNEPTPPTLIPATEPGCNQNVLNTTEGSASLEAIYTANTIGTTWYSDGVQITGDNVPGSCTYGSIITLPTPPTKAGYVFDGWRLHVEPACEIPSALVSTNGTSVGYKNYAYRALTPMNQNTSDYNLTEANTWGVTWSNGDKVTGVAFCSTTNNGKNRAQTGDPGTTGDGLFCWCKATHYTANNVEQCALSSPSWALEQRYSSTTYCATFCAGYCAIYVQTDFGFRSAVFTGLLTQ